MLMVVGLLCIDRGLYISGGDRRISEPSTVNIFETCCKANEDFPPTKSVSNFCRF